jgi:hypothetical protein
MVCVECTIRIGKSLRTQSVELLGDMGHVDSRIGLFGDSVSVDVG